MTPVQRVVAGVLRDSAGRVLITERPAGKPMSGAWEFPGGKLEALEAPEQGLARELREELGIELHRCHPLLQLRHDYGDRVIELEVFVVDESRGEPSGLEGQSLRWVSVAALSQQALLPADRPIVAALQAIEGVEDHNADEVIAHGAGHRHAGHSAR